MYRVIARHVLTVRGFEVEGHVRTLFTQGRNPVFGYLFQHFVHDVVSRTQESE